MPTPAAEVDVTPDLARRLLRAQHPDLADLSIRPFANGWDNVMLRLGAERLVRLPRRLAAAGLVEHEQRWLPTVAALVGRIATVPVPERVGVPTDGYPWAWSVVPFVHGVPATEASLDATFGARLGEFVRLLHVPAPSNAPSNPVRGVPLPTRSEALGQRLRSGRIPHPAAVGAAWERALAAPAHTGPPVWIHGDLHPLNILVDGGRLAAVVDFGDVAAGDPATDLATAWLTFGPDALEARRAFRTTVDVDDAAWERGRGWAVCIAAALVAASDDHPAHHALGIRTLDAVLAD
jgi:aminoglycoside phosphotransferase (APT) family kinase protein